MMQRTIRSEMTTWSALALGATLFVNGCGGDTSNPDDEDPTPAAGMGGTDNAMSGGTGGTMDASGGMATGTGGTGGAAGAAGAPPVLTLPDGTVCPPIPDNSTVTDFSEFDNTTGNWGDPAMTLTGTSFTYVGDDSSIMRMVDADGVMQLTGEATTFVGFGLAFGPSCNDASRFTGLSFRMGGSTTLVGGAAGEGALIEVQLQTRENAPAGSRGVCPGNFGAGCGFNTAVVGELTADGTVMNIPFTDITGGDPEATTDPQQLLGIQWQFGCSADGSATCDIAVTLDDVEFY